MKSKNALLVLALSFFTVTGALAQFSVGFNLGLPMGSPFSDTNNLGFGGTLRFDKAINDNLSWGLTGGYLSFAGKDLGGGVKLDLTSIPILAGITYNFSGADGGMYAGADLGMSFLSYTVNLGSFGSGSVTGSEFTIAPGVGYRAGAIDISARYNIISNFSNLGVRLAYVFGGGK